MNDGGRSRRSVLLATAGAGVLAAAALGYEAVRLLVPRHPPSPFDDLLALLPDRDAAAQVGLAYLGEHPHFDSKTAAHLLRKQIGSQPLASVLQADIARARLAEVEHWLLPETLALLSAIAAKT